MSRFTIVFDSFNDKENAFVFSTTPSGLRNDLTVLNDAIVQITRESAFQQQLEYFLGRKDNKG